nr:hypothetical protein [Tanacetum cinerariifolium]
RNFGSSVDTEKFREDPRSYHNKDIAVENSLASWGEWGVVKMVGRWGTRVYRVGEKYCGQHSVLNVGLIITALRDELRKLKRKAIADTMVSTYTIDPAMLKVDVEPIAPRLLNNRSVHFDYFRLTQEQAAILREVVEQWKSQNPRNNFLYHACNGY